MQPLENALPPFEWWCVQGQDVKSFGLTRDLLQQHQIGRVIDAGEVEMNQQAMVQLPSFALLGIVGIQQALHPLDR